MDECIARVPVRVSLGGGGTDFPAYYESHGGFAVGFALEHHVRVDVRFGSFDGGVHVHASDSGTSDLTRAFVMATVSRLGVRGGVQIRASSDVPVGAGLGTSASFIAGLYGALKRDPTAKPTDIAEQAGEIERVDVGRPVGKMDHYLGVLGGVHALEFTRTATKARDIEVTPALDQYISKRLLLFFTGVQRDAGVTLGRQESLLRARDRGTVHRLHQLKEIGHLVMASIESAQVEDIGPLLTRHWEVKKQLSPGGSSPGIELMYDVARSAGATGGKLLGAGAGGFLLVAASDEQAAIDIRARMREERRQELPVILARQGIRIQKVSWEEAAG